jgi:hypothetical protein
VPNNVVSSQQGQAMRRDGVKWRRTLRRPRSCDHLQDSGLLSLDISNNSIGDAGLIPLVCIIILDLATLTYTRLSMIVILSNRLIQ